MKELDENFLQSYFDSRQAVEVPEGLNESILAHVDKVAVNRLTNQRVLIWSCIGSVVVALVALFWYLHHIGSLEFKSIEPISFSATDALWVFLGICMTGFMALSLYLSRRLDRG